MIYLLNQARTSYSPTGRENSLTDIIKNICTYSLFEVVAINVLSYLFITKNLKNRLFLINATYTGLTTLVYSAERIAFLYKKNTYIQNQQNELKQNIIDLNTSNATLEKDLKLARQEVANLKARLSQAQKDSQNERRSKNSKIALLTNKVDGLDRSKAQLERELSEANEKAKNTDVQQLQERIVELKSLVEDPEAAEENLDTIARLESKLKTSKKEVTKLKTLVATLQQQIANLNETKDESEEIATLRRELRKVNQLLKNATTQLEFTQREKQTLNTKVRSLEVTIEGLERKKP